MSHRAIEMLDLYEKRYPYNYRREDILRGFSNFDKADVEPDPMYLFLKDWDTTKRDLTKFFLGEYFNLKEVDSFGFAPQSVNFF